MKLEIMHRVREINNMLLEQGVRSVEQTKDIQRESIDLRDKSVSGEAVDYHKHSSRWPSRKHAEYSTLPRRRREQGSINFPFRDNRPRARDESTNTHIHPHACGIFYEEQKLDIAAMLLSQLSRNMTMHLT